MSSVVLRLKRKACTEPAEGLMIALKKSKFDEGFNASEVYFKFAATLESEKDSVKDRLQAVLSKEKSFRYRDPKNSGVALKNVQNISDRLKREYKAASEKKRLDLRNSRRLILSETVPIDEEKQAEEDNDEANPNTEVRKLFQLYDIIEENEEAKKQTEEAENTITCNDELLVREKVGEYVFDVYISDQKIDDSFVENPICVRPCSMIDADLYSGDSDSSAGIYEDEDDSNEENNWRNDYPEDESSENSEKDSEDGEELFDRSDFIEVRHNFNSLNIGQSVKDNYEHYNSDEDDDFRFGYDDIESRS